MTTQPMIVCTFCETQQPNAWDCSNCGRPLHERPRNAPVPVEALAELEQTALPSAGNVALGAVEGLEATAMVDSKAIAVAPSGDPAVEATALVDSRAIATTPDAVPELERTRIDEDAPTALPTAIACRYCGTPWQGGSRLCARCGMKVAVPAALLGAKPAAGAARPADDGERVNCTSCGARNQVPGVMCSSCGQLIRARS